MSQKSTVIFNESCLEPWNAESENYTGTSTAKTTKAHFL